MNEKNILTVKELANYIRFHEGHLKPLKENYDYSGLIMNNGVWRLKLASADCRLQKELIESNDDDLDLLIHSKNKPRPLSSMIDETLIDLDFYADNRSKALSKLAKMASSARVCSSYEELYLELDNRERLLSTAIGNGVAIPHSRFPHQLIYDKPKLIIARSSSGVNFGAPDGKKVHLFLMPCAPTQFVHFRMIAQIAKLLHIPNVLERFRNIKKKGDFKLVVQAFERLNILPADEPDSYRHN